MALSGTLDSFALPDVLRLLASTNKTGRLRVTGNRGAGSVWVDDGEIVSTELTPPGWVDPTHAEVLFSLLRFGSGSFTFEAQARTANPSSPEQLEPSLVTAEHMLIEWRAIEEIIPSLDVYLTLAPEPTGGDVMIDAPRWRCIAAVAGGATADSAGATLGVSELEVCRTIKELVELGLLVVGEAPTEVGATAEPQSIGQPHADVEADIGIEGNAEVVVEADAEVELEADAGVDVLDVNSDGGHFNGEPDTDDADPERGVADVGVIGDTDETAFESIEPVSGPIEQSQRYEYADHDTTGEAEPIVTTAPGLAGLGAETAPSSTAPSDSVVEGLPETVPVTPAEYPIGGGSEGGGSDGEPIEAAGGERSVAPTADEPIEAGGGGPFGAASADEVAASDLDPAEMARQLANLSPQAAKAVAAAAKASTDAEREAALAAVEAEDETVNRGLLLKFLGSVDT